jgi:hypothetical protein
MTYYQTDRRILGVEAEYFDDSEDKSRRSGGRVATWHSNWVYWTKIIGIPITFLVGFGCLAAVIWDRGLFSLGVQISSFFREGTIGPDGLPTVRQFILGTIDTGLVVAFVCILAFIGLIVAIAVHDAEVAQMRGGSNGYIFVFIGFFNIPLILVCGLIAGIASAEELAGVVGLSLLRLSLMYLSDLLNSNGYKPVDRKNLYRCIWLPYGVVVLATLALYLLLFVPLGIMYGQSAIAPPASLIAIPVVALLFDLAIVIVIGLYTSSRVVTTIGTRDLIIYVLAILLAVVFSLVSFVVFATDGIVPLLDDIELDI